jgi:cytochrome c553
MHRLLWMGLLMALAAQAQDSQVERGRSLYSQLCATCHEGQQSTTGQAIRAAAGAPERILEATRNIGAMGPLRSIVTDTMAGDIAAWLATMYPPAPRTSFRGDPGAT